MNPQATALTRRRGFAVATSVLGLFLFAAAAPTPLYGDYATRWHFSRISLTAVFAVYAVALLATLLTCGTLSDALGRRPVILLSLVVMAAADVAFLAADGLAWLYLARILQGLATGLMTAAVAATLIDLQPAERPALGATVNAVTPTFGLGAGALASSLLVQYGPTPTLATPHGRAGLVSAIYISAYLAFSVPAVAAGILSTHIGLTTTAVGYGTAVAVLATAAGLATARTTPPSPTGATRAGRSARSAGRADHLSVNDPTTR